MDALVAKLTQLANARLSHGQALAESARLVFEIETQVDRIASAHDGDLVTIESAFEQDAAQVYGATSVLLRIDNEEANDLLIHRLLTARSPECLSAMALAFCDSPSCGLPLELLLDAAGPEVASAILLVLTAKQRYVDNPKQIESFMSAEAAETRVRAWHIVALLGEEHGL